jgi:hypothetical protein
VFLFCTYSQIDCAPKQSTRHGIQNLMRHWHSMEWQLEMWEERCYIFLFLVSYSWSICLRNDQWAAARTESSNAWFPMFLHSWFRNLSYILFGRLQICHDLCGQNLFVLDDDKYGHDFIGEDRIPLIHLKPQEPKHMNIYLEKHYPVTFLL